MRASVNERYGSPDVLTIRDIPTPQPTDDEIQVKVCATPQLDLAADLGADEVIDYTAEDFTQIGASFDFVLDAVGKTSYFACRPLLKPTGVFAATDLGPWWQNIVLSLWSSITRSGRVVFPTPRADRALVEFLSDRIEANELRAVVDRTYPLENIADAFRYVETQQKIGIVVIDVGPGSPKSNAIQPS